MDLRPRNKVKVEAGMASMTDLVFLLLIFFIIMSLMANNQTPIDLPKPEAAAHTELSPIKEIVRILEDNRYVLIAENYQSKPMDYNDDMVGSIASMMEKQETSESEGKKLRIEGHKKASYEAIFKVLALAQENGWDPVLAYKK